MARNQTRYGNIDGIKKMAKEYGVASNPLFLSALENYETVQKAIEQINKILFDDDILTTKEYVKGRENVYIHPAIKELPRHIDMANKTRACMIDIIEKFGTIGEKDPLQSFLGGDRQ